MATTEATPAEKTGLAIRREPVEWENQWRDRPRVRKKSVQWELCTVTASKFSVSKNKNLERIVVSSKTNLGTESPSCCS